MRLPGIPKVGYRRGFSRIDLAGTVSAVALLAVVQLAWAAASRGSGQNSVCLNNHRTLTLAWKLYALDNDGRLVGNLDGGDVSNGANSNRTWVLGWLDFNGGTTVSGVIGGRANTNTHLLTLYSPLAPYTSRRASVFKCPADTSLSLGTRGAPRVRSVAMNSYMGARGGPFTAGYRQFYHLNGIIEPAPAQASVFIDEREDSINEGWFAMDMGGFDPPVPQAHRIIDYPADWHDRGCNLSFADGHVEYWRWSDPRTMPRRRRGVPLRLGVASPNNPDVARLQAAASSRVGPEF